MFIKLLRHEFHSVKKTMLFLNISILLIWILCLITGNRTQSNFTEPSFYALLSIMGSALKLTAVFLMAGAMLYLYCQFYKKKFTAEGYLTFTIPASTHLILLASASNVLLWTLITAVCFILTQTVFFTNFVLAQSASFYAAFAISGSFLLVILPLLCITIGAMISKKNQLFLALGFYLITGPAFIAVIGILAGLQAPYAVVTVSILTLVFDFAGYFLLHYLFDNKLELL